MIKLITAAAVLFASPAFASTPDGQTPAEETYCDDQSGAAFGICNAYCEAMDCGDDNQRASDRACEQKERQYLRITGEEMPTCGAAPPPPPTCEDKCDAQYDIALDECDSEEPPPPPPAELRVAADDGCVGEVKRCEEGPNCENAAESRLLDCYDACKPVEECPPTFPGYCDLPEFETERIDTSITDSCACEDAGGTWVPEERRR